MLYDDVDGLFAVGGSEYRHSFRGYIGHVTLYRNLALDFKQVHGHGRRFTMIIIFYLNVFSRYKIGLFKKLKLARVLPIF